MTDSDYDPAAAAGAGQRFFILSGCSGGGKSTLLAALGARGYAVYPEAGRQIVREQQLIGGDALPGSDPHRFVELVLSRTIFQRADAARRDSVAIFDRGLLDALAFLERQGGAIPSWLLRAIETFPHHGLVFMVPPWREIFVGDAERRHSFDEALREYDHLLDIYARHGCELMILPQAPVSQRADMIAKALADVVIGS